LRPLLSNAHPSLERADTAHTLKGSARAIGAWRLASLADRLEAGLRSGGAGTDVAPLTPAFDEAIEATRGALAERERASAA
jgi:HPt (histidine-containing phosphotransfer) domain-containing protein